MIVPKRSYVPHGPVKSTEPVDLDSDVYSIGSRKQRKGQMPNRLLWRLVLIVVLCITLAAPARASGFDTLGREIVAGIVLVSVAIGVAVTFLILHQKGKHRTITGCVAAGPTGVTLKDEKDKQVYALSGNQLGIKPGDRMTVEGKKKKSDNARVFEANRVTKDFGVCPI